MRQQSYIGLSTLALWYGIAANHTLSGTHMVAYGCAVHVCRQAVAAAEAYIKQHGLDDVQIEVETRTLEELQEVGVHPDKLP